MTWRILLSKLSFPLFVGVSLAWGLQVWNRRQENQVDTKVAIAVAQAVDRQAAYDAKSMAKLLPNNFTNCGIVDWGQKPIDVDGNPKHASSVLWTRFSCAERGFTIWGKLPRLLAQR